ncbi:hypothetical protein D9M69_639770 [compost metagenome]
MPMPVTSKGSSETGETDAARQAHSTATPLTAPSIKASWASSIEPPRAAQATSDRAASVSNTVATRPLRRPMAFVPGAVSVIASAASSVLTSVAHSSICARELAGQSNPGHAAMASTSPSEAPSAAQRRPTMRSSKHTANASTKGSTRLWKAGWWRKDMAVAQ